MLKPFTTEGRFECGLDEIVRGKIWAFVAVVGEHTPARLGVAIANEPGYYPIPEHWCHGDYDDISAHADELNRAEGLDLHISTLIVASTMGGRRKFEWPITDDGAQSIIIHENSGNWGGDE